MRPTDIREPDANQLRDPEADWLWLPECPEGGILEQAGLAARHLPIGVSGAGGSPQQKSAQNDPRTISNQTQNDSKLIPKRSQN